MKDSNNKSARTSQKDRATQTIQTRRSRLVSMTGKEMLDHTRWNTARFTKRDMFSMVGLTVISVVVLLNLVWLACQMAKV